MTLPARPVLLLLLLASACGAAPAVAPVSPSRPAAAAVDPAPYVFAMYMSGHVTEYAQGMGLSDRDYIAHVLDDMKAMGVNAVHPNNLDFDSVPLWIELCRERGMRLIPEGGQPMRDYYIWNPRDHAHFGHPDLADARAWFRREMIPHYRTLAERYRDDPTLLAWNATEEIALDEPWIFEDLRDLIADHDARDPNHPAFVEYHWADMACSGIARTRPALVAAGFGMPDEPWHEHVDWHEVWIDQVATCARQAGARFWLVPSSTFVYVRDGDGWVPRGGRLPTAEEIGLQVWLGYAGGAQGMDFWWYHDYVERQDDGSVLRFRGVRDLADDRKTPMWEAIRRIASEVEPLAPWLPRLRVVEGNGGIPYAREGHRVRARLLEDPATGERYLLAVNKNVDEALPLGLDLGAPAVRLPDRTPVDPAALEIPPGSGVLLALGRP